MPSRSIHSVADGEILFIFFRLNNIRVCVRVCVCARARWVGRGWCYWHTVDRGQRCSRHPKMPRIAPHNKESLAQNVNSIKVGRNPGLEGNFVTLHPLLAFSCYRAPYMPSKGSPLLQAKL